MAQIGIHVVNIYFGPINPNTGAPMMGNDPTVTIKQRTSSQSKHVIMPSSDVPNSAGYPEVAAYLKLEAASGYVLQHIDQTFIVTYYQHDLNTV